MEDDQNLPLEIESVLKKSPSLEINENEIFRRAVEFNERINKIESLKQDDKAYFLELLSIVHSKNNETRVLKKENEKLKNERNMKRYFIGVYSTVLLFSMYMSYNGTRFFDLMIAVCVLASIIMFISKSAFIITPTRIEVNKD